MALSTISKSRGGGGFCPPFLDILQSNQSRWKLVHTLPYAHLSGLNPKITKKVSHGQENGYGKVVFAYSPLQRAKFLKNGFLAIAHQGLTRDQKFWHTPVVTQWDRTFLFSKLFSLVNYMVTVGHLGFQKNRVFQLWGPLAGAPCVPGPQKSYQNLRMAFIWKVSQ